MTTIKAIYQQVNDAWPDKVPETFTFKEGVNAVRRLYRFLRGGDFPYTIIETSGRRYNGISSGTFRLNTEGNGHGHSHIKNAWTDLVHDLSHLAIQRGWYYGYTVKPHSKEHARLELKLVKEVVKRGWLTPAAKEALPQQVIAPKSVVPAFVMSPKPDPRVEKLQRARASLERWERKELCAKRAMAKLRRRIGYYARAGVV